MLGLVWTGDVEMQHWTKDVVNESAKKKKKWEDEGNDGGCL